MLMVRPWRPMGATSGEMAFAYWIAHAPRNTFPALNGGDAAILFCFVFLYLAAAGAGAWTAPARDRAGFRARSGILPGGWDATSPGPQAAQRGAAQGATEPCADWGWL